MIIHSILQQLENDGFGTVGQDLQIGVLPLDQQGDPRNGIAVTPRGSAVNRIQTEIQAVDFYVRNTNPLVASQTAQSILDWLKESFAEICTLPPLNNVTDEEYKAVVLPVSSVEYVGVDDNNGVSFVVSGEVRYKLINEGE